MRIEDSDKKGGAAVGAGLVPARIVFEGLRTMGTMGLFFLEVLGVRRLLGLWGTGGHKTRPYDFGGIFHTRFCIHVKDVGAASGEYQHGVFHPRQGCRGGCRGNINTEFFIHAKDVGAAGVAVGRGRGRTPPPLPANLYTYLLYL